MLIRVQNSTEPGSVVVHVASNPPGSWWTHIHGLERTRSALAVVQPEQRRLKFKPVVNTSLSSDLSSAELCAEATFGRAELVCGFKSFNKKKKHSNRIHMEILKAVKVHVNAGVLF